MLLGAVTFQWPRCLEVSPLNSLLGSHTHTDPSLPAPRWLGMPGHREHGAWHPANEVGGSGLSPHNGQCQALAEGVGATQLEEGVPDTKPPTDTKLPS